MGLREQYVPEVTATFPKYGYLLSTLCSMFQDFILKYGNKKQKAALHQLDASPHSSNETNLKDMHSLEKAGLRGYKREGIKWLNVNLKETCLLGAILNKANLQGSYFKKTDLRVAQLKEALRCTGPLYLNNGLIKIMAISSENLIILLEYAY